MCRIDARDGAEVRGQREDVRARRLPGNDVQNAPEDVDHDVRFREGSPALVLQQIHSKSSEDDDDRVEPSSIFRSFESVAVVCVAAEPGPVDHLFFLLLRRRRQGGSRSSCVAALRRRQGGSRRRAPQHCYAR